MSGKFTAPSRTALFGKVLALLVFSAFTDVEGRNWPVVAHDSGPYLTDLSLVIVQTNLAANCVIVIHVVSLLIGCLLLILCLAAS
jgi:hypothetical protein